MRALLAALGVVAALAAAPSARADDPTPEAIDEARTHYDRGRELYEAGHYAEALAELRRANELAPSYKILRSIGLVQGELGDYAGAVASLERYLESGGDAVTADQRTEAEARVAQYMVHVAVVDVATAPVGASVFIDGAPSGAAPLPHPVMLNAGHHTVSATLDGYAESTKEIDVAGSDHRHVDLALTPLAPPPAPAPPPPVTVPVAPRAAPPPPAPPPPAPVRHTPWAGWLATGGLALVAVATGVVALVTDSQLRDDKDNHPTPGSELDSLSSRARAFAVVSDICTGAAVVAGGLSLYLTLRAPAAPADEKPAVRVGAGLGSVVLDVRY